MADNFIQLPTNVEDPAILKRYLTELTARLNSNAFITYPMFNFSGEMPYGYMESLGAQTNSILEATVRLNALSGTVKNYISGDLKTLVLQNIENTASITEEFGAFYDTATAAAWYGLSVKAGGVISGFTVGSLDTDTTVPGTESSFFMINADTFSVGRAIEDVTDPAELAYLVANNLPYGTMYNSTTKDIIPAFIIEWNGTSYDIMFNGKVSFTNVTQTGNLLMLNDPISSLSNNLGFTTGQTFYQPTRPTTSTLGDLWIDTDDNNKVYTWTGTAWALVQDSQMALQVAQSKNIVFYQAATPVATKINDLWFDTDNNYKMFIWNGTAWVNATLDAALAVNSNTTTINGSKLTTGSITALQIAANTITAAKLVAGTITANEIAAGTITSTQLNATSINAMGIVAGSVAAENITGTTITGKTISGGTITGTTINASTINIRNLNLVNDAGYAVDPFFTIAPNLVVTGTDPKLFVIETDMYTYNSTNASTKRTIGTTGTKVFLSELDASVTASIWAPVGYLPIAASIGTMTFDVAIMVGTSYSAITLASRTSFSVNTDYNIGGFIFRYHYDANQSYDYTFCIKATTADISVASTSSNPIKISMSVNPVSSFAFRLTGFSMLVSNL